MASENESWGYTRIVGELSKLGHRVSRSTVRRILKERGIGPAPERLPHMPWSKFLKAHWEALAAADFFTVEVWTRIGLVRYLVFFVIDLRSRRVEIAGIAPVPNGLWMHQVPRNLIDDVSGFLRGKGFLIHDRDPLYTRDFRELLSHAGVTAVRLPPRSPNLRSLWSGVFQGSRVDAEIREEFRHHIELRTQDLIRDGLTRKEAARRAHVEFGHAEAHKERTRAARGLRFFDQMGFSWIDVKLGLRMLVKNPLLTITGCVAIATAIAINAGFNEFMGDFFGRFEIPQSGGRLVALTNQDLESGGREGRVLEDLSRWRTGLETVERLGAVTMLDLNLVAPDGRSTPVDAAEVSASVFDVTGTLPALGRTLLDSDDGPAAEPVVILGFGVWQNALGGDPNVIGATVRLGEVVHTVVGVAPEDFSFPRGREEVWVNFRHDPGAFARRTGPSVLVFGRLAPGRSLSEAQAELALLGTSAAADYPDTHGQLRPTVRPFEEVMGLASSPLAVWALRGARTFFVLLLMAACANVAALVFARNAAREREIAIRNALGAGRRRIVMQLFAEAMVLALLSAAIGLVVADVGLRYGSELFWEAQRTDPPAWFDAGLSLPIVLYSLVLATLGAGVVGILPGLRATRGGAADTLRRAGSGSGTLSFGGLPTAVIVVQTAITVALLPVVLTGSVADFNDRQVDASLSREGYLTARLMVDSDIRRVTAAEDAAAGGEPMYVDVLGVSGRYRITQTLLERYDEMAENIRRRLANEPRVRRVAVTSRLPAVVGQSLPRTQVELNGESNPDGGWRVRTTEADLGLFDVVGRTVVDGRAFTAADYVDDQRVALVNTAVVRELYGGRSPVGRLVRDFRPEGNPDRPWTEIVGVIPDDVAGPGGVTPHLYLPLTGPGHYPLKLLVHVDGEAAAFAPRMRALVADVEPGMLLDEIIPLAEMRRSEVIGGLFGVVIMLFVALVTTLLSTSGVYALMSFIVAQRTREIGIRTALGAGAPLVVRGVFRRALMQLSLGVVVGLAMVGLVLGESVAEGATRDLILSGIGVAAVLMVVGLIGCAVPLARALRVQPMQALSAE